MTDSLEADLRAMIQAAQGCLEMIVVDQFAMAGLWLHEPTEACRYLTAITSYLEIARQSARGKGPLCMLCPVEFGPGRKFPEAFCFLVPFAAETEVACVHGLCSRCHAMPVDELKKRMLEFWRQIDPSARAAPEAGSQ